MTIPVHAAASVFAASLALSSATPALAQQSASVAQELTRMRTEMERMSQRIDELESQLAQTQASAAAANTAASEARAVAVEAKKPPQTEVSWKGAPQFKAPGGWSFKPRGRLQIDAGMIDAPASTGRSDGFGSEMRRARLGVEGDIPGGFGYKFEADFAGNEVEIADAIVTYQHKSLKVSIGQHNSFQSLEELTSSLNTSMMERAAFTDAFGFERRVGLSAQYTAGNLLVQGGVFTDNMSDLPNKGWSSDGRVVFMPKLGEAQVHLAGSVHFRELNDAATTVRYRQRPFLHTTGERFIDTRAFSASSETGYGLEAAVISGRFHAAGEAYWQKVARPAGLADPTFFGGYAEVGYFLTGGDTRGYKSGIFDRIKPSKPVGKGGIGAVQVNLRYDRLDLSDAGIAGGRQNGVAVSVIWTPTEYTRLMMNYGRMHYDDAIHPVAGGDTSYSVNAFGMRAQIDF
jgi:phosphate-selective porin OprO/OprP